MLEEQLKNFGLSEKEAKVYLNLLENGESSATDVSKQSEVNRSSTYVVLESLEKKGLVSNIQTAGKQTFRASPPEKLASIADELLKQHQEIHDAVKNILPELKGVFADQAMKPKIGIYEGKKGLKNALYETLKSNEKLMRVISDAPRMTRYLGLDMKQYIKDRTKLGIKMKGIHPDNVLGRALLKVNPNDHDESILVKSDVLNVSVDVAIYDDIVAFMSMRGEGYAVRIESKEYAEITKKLFDLAFDNLKLPSRD